MASSPRLTPEDHLSRATEHERIADTIASTDLDWAAVPYFYAGFHLVRHSLLVDPIFDDPTRCSRLNPALTPDDCHVTRHHGRVKPARIWGVNELVSLLYPAITVDYELLHLASIDVRYGVGFAGDLADVRAALGRVREAHSAGGLVAA